MILYETILGNYILKYIYFLLIVDKEVQQFITIINYTNFTD